MNISPNENLSFIAGIYLFMQCISNEDSNKISYYCSIPFIVYINKRIFFIVLKLTFILMIYIKIIQGKYVPKKIESLLRKYINEYVTCAMCRSPATTLTRDSVSRLYFVNCTSCGASRAVSTIKSGFHAVKRGERRKARG